MKKYFIALIILLFASFSHAANFYCDCSVSGGTGGAGSYADPFESIADLEAYETATGFADGDDIYFLEGSTCTMTSDLDIYWEGTGTGNYSILGCYDGDSDFDCDGSRPILQRSGGYGHIFFNDDTQYFRIEYLHLKDTNASWQNTGSIGIGTKPDGSGGNHDEGYITITNCIFYHFGHYAFSLVAMGTNVIITDNECDTQNGNCIYITDESGDGASYGYIANNTCDELIGYNGTDGHCVGLQSTDYYIVEDNVSVDAYNSVFILWTWMYYESIHNVFRNNKSDGNRQVGVSFYQTAGNSKSGYGNLAYGNIIKEPADETSDRPGIWLNNFDDSRGNYVFNNTVYDAGYSGIGIRSTSGGIADYLSYLNNIIVVDALTADQNELVWVEEGGTNNTNITIDCNLWWSLGGNPSAYTLWETPDDDTDMTWANWKSDGWGGNDIVDNPDFVDTTDFELEEGSPAIDAGTWLTNVTSASGSGSSVNVSNTYILHSDFGLVDEDGSAIDGMLISFYDATNGRQDREITDIDYGGQITLDSSTTWIYNASYPNDPDYTTQIALRFYGSAPDIGAVEYGEEAGQGTGKINVNTSGTGKINVNTSGTGKMVR